MLLPRNFILKKKNTHKIQGLDDTRDNLSFTCQFDKTDNGQTINVARGPGNIFFLMLYEVTCSKNDILKKMKKNYDERS